jgi:hypothetical protein
VNVSWQKKGTEKRKTNLALRVFGRANRCSKLHQRLIPGSRLVRSSYVSQTARLASLLPLEVRRSGRSFFVVPLFLVFLVLVVWCRLSGNQRISESPEVRCRRFSGGRGVKGG